MKFGFETSWRRSCPRWVEIMGRLASADWSVTTESGVTRYLEEVRRVPMLEPHEEYMLAKRWREHGDHAAAHQLVNSHLRLVARIATYATWWIKAAIKEYILRSWSLVKMGTTVNQKKLFFNLRKAKNKITVLDEGDMRPDEVKIIARQLGVTQTDVIHMNRRLGGGDVSLNATIREDGNSGEWEDRLVDEHADQETTLAASEEFENRLKALASALSALNDRERRIFEARRLAEEPITLSELADEFGVSRERVRQISVCAFEKVQRAVRHRVAVMETPAPLLAQ